MTILVKLEHARGVGYCARGMRLFAQQNDLDWNRFITEGIPAEELEATGDAMAIEAATNARREAPEAQSEAPEE